MSVPPRAAWINVDRSDSHLFKPALHFFGNELRSIVATDKLGHPTLTHHFTQGVEDVATSQTPFWSNRQALSGIFADESQHLQLNSVLGSGVHKVPAPDFIHGACLDWECCRSSTSSSTRLLAFDAQAFEPPDLLNKLSSDLPSFTNEKGSDSAISIAGIFPAQSNNTFNQLLFPIASTLTIVPTRTRQVQVTARTTHRTQT